MSFNAKLASKITTGVFTMWTAYLFTLLALLSLPAVLNGVSPKIGAHFPHWLISASLIALVGWVSSYFLQLVLLPIIGVGQKQSTDAVKDHIDGKHSEITNLHDAIHRDILRIHSHFNIKQESNNMDEVKQHVEAALEAVEKVVSAVESGPEAQLVKDKLVDIRDFLERVDTPASPEAQGESAPEVPATPVDNPTTDAPVNDTPPVEQPTAPEAPATNQVTDPVPPVEPAQPPVDGTEVSEADPSTEVDPPVTDSNEQPVADPNAPR